MVESSEINGTVSSVIFRNDENGYAVVRILTENGETTTAVGCLPYVAPGETISAEGTWMTHAQHGRQFRIEQCNRMLPVSADDIYEYLAGGTGKGIGPATAAMIVDKFGARRALQQPKTVHKELKGADAKASTYTFNSVDGQLTAASLSCMKC